MSASISPFLDPDSVTVIGVSRNLDKIGRKIYDQIDLSGKVVYGVNQIAFKIRRRKIYASVSKLPKVPDLAIYAIPSEFVLTAVKEAAQLGIKNHLIISSGFSETGHKGLEKELELQKLIKKYGINIQGPNCLGNISPYNNFNASFADMPRRGNVGLILQSGAIGTSFFDWALKENIGISSFVSLGNKINLSENDYLTYLVSDSNTKVIGLYLENIKDPLVFLDLCQTASKVKPVVILKTGQSEESKVAISSHTGAMAGVYEAQFAAFKQANLINADNLENFFYLLSFFSKYPSRSNLDEAIIITNAGGPAVITVDELSKNNINLKQFTPVFKNRIANSLPVNASVNNPIDILGDADPKRLIKFLTAINPPKLSDLCILHLTPQENTDLNAMARILSMRKFRFKGVLIVNIIGGELADGARYILKKAGILCFDFLDDIITLIKKISYYFSNRLSKHRPVGSVNVNSSTRKKIYGTISRYRNFLPEDEVLKIIKSYRFPVPLTYFVDSLKSCTDTALRIGFPVVLKISSPEIIHRNKENGVFLNIHTVSELTAAYDSLAKFKRRIIIQKMINPDAEIIIGAKRDAEFKYLIMFGSGGIHTDYLKDISFRVLPLLSAGSIKELISETKISALIPDPELFMGIFRSLASLLSDNDNIDEIDLNPVVLSHSKLSCVDVKIKGETKL